MSRLPTPGGDESAWGAILNDYLQVSLNADGTLKSAGAIASAQSAAQAAQQAAATAQSTANAKYALPSGGVPETDLSSGVQAKLNAGSNPGNVADASTSAKGIVQLAGDLGGTATLPTVPGLAGKAADNAVVHLAGAETISGNKTFSGTVTVQTPSATGHATTKAYVDSAISGVTSSGAPDATTSTKGIVQLAGDLGGTAASPTVTKVNGVTVTGAPASSGLVLKSTSTTAASWQADATGGGGSTFTAVPVSGTHTALNYEFSLCNAQSAGFTLTLPTASNGAWVRVKKTDGGTNAIIVQGQGGSTINGSPSAVVNSPSASQDFMCDGTNWHLI